MFFKMKDYILNGHMYIANMTRRIWCYNNEDSFVTYEKLRSINRKAKQKFIIETSAYRVFPEADSEG